MRVSTKYSGYWMKATSHMSESNTSSKTETAPDTPRGALTIRQMAMPGNMNAGGHIFGGWLLSQMDIAGGITAADRAKGRVATVAVKAMEFHQPVHVGDVLCCYTDINRVGTTSISVNVQAWVHRRRGEDLFELKVTEGEYVFVALDEEGNKRHVPPE